MLVGVILFGVLMFNMTEWFNQPIGVIGSFLIAPGFWLEFNYNRGSIPVGGRDWSPIYAVLTIFGPGVLFYPFIHLHYEGFWPVLYLWTYSVGATLLLLTYLLKPWVKETDGQ